MALAESVHKYMAATGESATTASAQVQAFNELGISEDVAQAAMVKLSKAIETTPKKLAAVGIEVAKDAKGNVDLNASLLNVIDAWNGTEDAAKRNEIALIAFGKNGVAAMLPILEAGSASLRQLEKDVRVTMTDADIAQAHKYVLEQKQVQASFNAVQDSIGQQVLPKLGALYDAYLKQEYVHKRMAESGVSDDMVLGQSTNDLVHKFEKEYDAAQTAKEKLNALADAHTQAGIAAAEQAKALDDLINSEEAQANASIHAQRADLAVAESAGKVDKAQDALNKTIAQYGPKSEEAQAAAFALSGTLLDQQQAYLDAATAAQTLAKDQAGPDVSAADAAAAGHQALIDKLTAEASTLAPGSALRVWLDQYIGKLHETPTDITTTFHTVGGVGGSALSAASPAADRRCQGAPIRSASPGRRDAGHGPAGRHGDSKRRRRRRGAVVAGRRHLYHGDGLGPDGAGSGSVSPGGHPAPGPGTAMSLDGERLRRLAVKWRSTKNFRSEVASLSDLQLILKWKEAALSGLEPANEATYFTGRHPDKARAAERATVRSLVLALAYAGELAERWGQALSSVGPADRHAEDVRR